MPRTSCGFIPVDLASASDIFPRRLKLARPQGFRKEKFVRSLCAALGRTVELDGLRLDDLLDQDANRVQQLPYLPLHETQQHQDEATERHAVAANEGVTSAREHDLADHRPDDAGAQYAKK